MTVTILPDEADSGSPSHAARPVSQARLGAPTADPASFIVAGIVMFVLGFGFPTDWFIVDRGDFDSVSAPPQGFVPAILALALAFAFVTTLHAPQVYIKLIAMEPLLAGFVMLAIFSALWSAFPGQTLRFGIPLLVVVLLGYWMVSVFRLEQLLAIMATVLVLGILLSLAFVFVLPQYGQSRIGFSGPMTDKNVFGRMMSFSCITLFVGAGVFRRYRLLLGFFSIVAFGLVVGSESATAMAGTIFTLGMFFICKLFRSRKTLYGAIVVGLLGGGTLGVFIATANLGFLAGLFGKDVTLTGRTRLWRLSIEEGLNQPLFGHGWGGFWQGWFSPSRPVLDANNWLPPHAHNALIDYFVTLGVAGAAIGAALFLRFFVRGARAVRYRPGTLGLWPMTYGCFCFIFSITEFGVINRNLFFLTLVILVSVAALDRSGTGVLAEPNNTPERRPLEVVPT